MRSLPALSIPGFWTRCLPAVKKVLVKPSTPKRSSSEKPAACLWKKGRGYAFILPHPKATASPANSSAPNGIRGKNFTNTKRISRKPISTLSAALSPRIVAANGMSKANDPNTSLAPRIALIGCGLVGQKRLSNLPPGCVTMACDLNLERASKLASHTKGCEFTDSIEKAVSSPNVDAVMIATVNASLAPIACQAVKAGKHVLVEKPGAISAKELDKLAALANQQRVQVRVGYNHRYHPAFLKMREIVDSGALGPIMFLRARYGQGGRVGYDREWRADPKLSGGGELLDQGVHLIDLAGIFLGEFTIVEGHTATYFWN